MSQQSLADIAARAGATPVRAGPGDILFRPDDPCEGFIALRRGTIRVALTSPGGREIVLYRVRPGEICLQTFSCLLENKHYAAEGVAEDDVEALLVAPSAFDRLMVENDAFRSAVLGSVAARFSDFEQVVETLAFTGLDARVASALLRLADAAGTVTTTHEALANEIGSAREAVSRQLGLFARQELVSLSRGRVEIKRRDALSRLAQAAM